MSKVKSERLGREFDVNIVHAGLVPAPWSYGGKDREKRAPQRAERLVDRWIFVFIFALPGGGSESVDYYTGLGHRKILPERLRRWHKDILASDPENWTDAAAYRGYVESDTRPVVPKLDDLLASLVMDSSAVGMSFEDWAEELGYDTDSRSALATYEACQQNAKRLVRITGVSARDLGKLAEAFADY